MKVADAAWSTAITLAVGSVAGLLFVLAFNLLAPGEGKLVRGDDQLEPAISPAVCSIVADAYRVDVRPDGTVVITVPPREEDAP